MAVLYHALVPFLFFRLDHSYTGPSILLGSWKCLQADLFFRS
jgi:hypothetical protein